MYTSRVLQADPRAAAVGTSAARKNVSWNPKRRLAPPSAARRFPVQYHHSVRKVGCGP
jgi:hypothetical protein